ncbi:hypothetical protein FQN54_009490 [Arachnomyces sp. PD_36]|nr:hypothetical protein FQN54_009490 [Arachnomyces sp. PD_36]
MASGEETFRSAFPSRDHPHISFGIPFPEAVAKHASSTFHASRVYILSSGSLARNTEALARLQAALGDKVVGTRIGMRSHTMWSEVLQVTREASAVGADLLVTLGAGSLTDAAKIVAFAMANGVDDIDGLSRLSASSSVPRSELKAPTAPIISIPTSLSAGEYSNGAGGTNDETEQKHMFSPPIRGPALVILDADLTVTTPDSIWLSTGIRAVDHCVETMCSLVGNTAAADKTAEEGLKKLVPGLLNTKRDRTNLDARHSCQMGAIDAMTSIGSVELGASHGIGHQLGPLGVGHGETSCILLPSVCKYNAEKGANVDRQRAVFNALIQITEVSEVLKRRGIDTSAADLGDVLDAIIRELGLPRSLADFKIGRDKLDGLAENSLRDRWCVTNPVPLKEKGQVLEILEKVVD